MSNFNLDLQGLKCPLPLLKTKKFLSNLLSGDVVEVISDDPASAEDLADFCYKTTNILIKQSIIENLITSIIMKK